MNMALVILTIICILLCFVWAIEYFKESSLDKIRHDVYKLFLKAEHCYEESKSGKQKMKWVISKARGLLPNWVQMIITEEMFERIVQYWFDGIKDLLDDGKINSLDK